MMMAMKPKVKSKPKARVGTGRLKNPAEYLSSDEEELETIGEKLEKIQNKKKRSRWGDDSATLEIGLEPYNGSSDEEDDDDEEEEDDRNPGTEGGRLSFLSQVADKEAPRSPTARETIDSYRPPALSPYHLHRAPSTSDIAGNEPAKLPPLPPPTLTDSGPACLDAASENYQSWAKYFLEKGQPFPRDFMGLSYSPEVQVVATRKPPEASTEPAAKKKKTKKPDLTPALSAFRFDHRDRLILGEELNPRNREHPGPCTVAQYIEIGSEARGNYQKTDLRDLGSDAIRKLASNFGCKGTSSASMFDCRLKMAVRKTAGTAYGNLDMPNPVTTAAERKVNTQMRIATTVFLPQFVNRFIKLNDTKQRNELEAAGGGSPYKLFWKDISATVNDAEQDALIKTLLESLTGEAEGADPTLRDLAMNGNYNLSDYNQVDWQVCARTIRDIFKALEKIETAMKQSGIHCTDLWQYCRKTFLRVRKGVEVPAVVAYYVHLLCRAHPGIEGNFAQCLEDHLKSDSTTSPADPKDRDQTSALTSKTKNADTAAFLETLEKTSTGLQATARADIQQRQKLIDYQLAKAEDESRNVEDSRIERNWKEYDALSVRVLSLKKQIRTCNDVQEQGETLNYLYNLAIRIRALEIQLEIEEHNSIVKAYMRRAGDSDEEE